MAGAGVPWACADCGALDIHTGRGRTPERCKPCRRQLRTERQRHYRRVQAEKLTASGGSPWSVARSSSVRVDPEPSKVPQVRAAPRARAEPPRLQGGVVGGNQWSRRGKIPLDLTGCPDPAADLPAARAWVMEHVFRVKLYGWQVEELRVVGNLPRPRRAYEQIGRKNGKTLFAAAIILTELVLLEEAAVYAVSDSERNLNSVLMRELRTLIGRSVDADRAFIVTAKGIEYPHTGSFMQVLHGKFNATQGINPTLVVMDEVHLQKSDELWNGFLMAGAASRNFMLLGITTPGYDLSSFAHQLYQLAKAGTSPGLYARCFEPDDPDCDLADRTAWAQASPRLADDPDFMEAMEHDFIALPDHEFRRFRLGLWTSGESAWLPHGAWDSRATGERLTPLDNDPNRRYVLGFDGSYSGDSTALIVASGRHLSVAGCWENPGRKGWRVPRSEVDAVVSAWMTSGRNVTLLADPPYWGSEISEWSARWPGRVLEFPTHGTLTHDGDKRLARHIANAIVKSSPQGDYITKPEPNSPAKIDLAVAAVVAYSMASQAVQVRHPAGAR
jgi:hypothetical protein